MSSPNEETQDMINCLFFRSIRFYFESNSIVLRIPVAMFSRIHTVKQKNCLVQLSPVVLLFYIINTHVF